MKIWIISKSVAEVHPSGDDPSTKFEIRSTKQARIHKAQMTETILRLRPEFPGDELFVNGGKRIPTLTEKSATHHHTHCNQFGEEPKISGSDRSSQNDRFLDDADRVEDLGPDCEE